MANVSNYYKTSIENCIAHKECMVIGRKYRFTVLTDRLIRLQYSPSGMFEDRPTSRVIFRNFERPIFTVEESATLIQINTKYFTLNYVKDRSFKGGILTPASTLKVNLKNSDREWYYNHPEARNFGTINYSLDDFNGNLKLDKGLYSTDGFCVIDDSDSLVLNDAFEFVKRDHKEMDLYLFMYRRDFSLCLQDYYMLTGYPSLIPRYALGNWWYKNEKYTNNDIYEVIDNFNKNKIPLKVLVLGDFWHDNLTPYIFDNTVINAGELLNYLNSRNIKLALTINPSLKVDSKSKYYNNFSSLLENNSFVPFSNSSINVYYNMILKPLFDSGISLINIDYNNPKDRLGLWQFNNLHVSMQEQKGIRGLILSRNSKIAQHRYPIVFSGKTRVSWNTLNALPRYNLSASNMGISWVAHAIGGYYKGIEQEELYLRYIELATFSPIFLLASERGKYYKREPWKWNDKVLEITREYMQLRQRLIPYIYNEAYIYHLTGAPLIQAFYYQYPKIYDEPYYKNQYFFGRYMFVAPITKKKNVVMNRVVQRLFVPDGTWFDFKSGLKYPGGKYYMNFYKDNDYPVFCKAGSIIPLAMDTLDIPKTIELIIFPLDNNSYDLYEDDGITNRYTNKEYLITNYEYNYIKDNYTLKISKKEGINLIDKRNYKIRFKNTKNVSNVKALVNGIANPANCYYDNTDLIIELLDIDINATVDINIMGSDIEVSTSRLITNDIKDVIYDLEIETVLKEKIDDILFSDMSIKKKRIAIRKLKKQKLEPRFIKAFLNLLDFMNEEK